MTNKPLAPVLALLLGAFVSAPVMASPCDTLICMTGKVLGQSGGDSCDQPIKDFFAIKRYHHGHLDLGPTSDARRQFLDQCPDGQQQNAGNVDQVINIFGTLE
jgi:hypothetical protein